MAPSKLFDPVKIGDLKLQHRVVLAPLTRLRADEEGVDGPLSLEYYTQRASTPGTLLISESTSISEAASGFPGMPGIYSDAQIEAWKKVTSSSYHDNNLLNIY
jgi:NADPH2 dehydrogenase